MFENAELKSLKLKIAVLEKWTGQNFDAWFEQWGNLEHKFHSRLEELNENEAKLNAREMLFAKELEAECSKSKAEVEKQYYGALNQATETMMGKYGELVKVLAEKSDKVNILTPYCSCSKSDK